MDIKCPICREPFDLDELHDVPGSTFDEAYAAFTRSGCGVVFNDGKSCGTRRQHDLDAVYELLGDDVDGAASIIEDLED